MGRLLAGHCALRGGPVGGPQAAFKLGKQLPAKKGPPRTGYLPAPLEGAQRSENHERGQGNVAAADLVAPTVASLLGGGSIVAPRSVHSSAESCTSGYVGAPAEDVGRLV